MLRLGKSRDSINVVADQFGCPTYAFHLADAIFSIVEQISNQKQDSAVWGIYHACGTGHASWFDFAGEIFAQAKSLGRPAMKVNPITTAQYPTPARRPANSRLDCSKLDKTFAIRLPDWHAGTAQCVRALVDGRG